MLLFRCGAMVAHSTVNRVVTGSSPVTGAKNKKGCSLSYKGAALFNFIRKTLFHHNKGELRNLDEARLVWKIKC